ncbi:hypothetical protein WDZ17_03970 [Pseudokineococcus basanitobsidens]|uniref:Uncharacterized protein n=1 Tax=Pseudokineococcus basanitobsidens TaxID=1926649 RepID=A0ABU8RHE7_9ACTN
MSSTGSRTTEDRRTSTGAWLGRGALGGLVGGAVFLAVNSAFVTTQGMPWPAPFRTIATLVQGPPPTEASVPLGVVLHVVISIAFGVVLALAARPVRRRPALVALGGLVAGLVIYLVDFQVLSRSVDHLSAFLAVTNQPLEVAAHLVFGAVAALFLLER